MLLLSANYASQCELRANARLSALLYTSLIWNYTFIKKKYIMSLHILATQFLRKTTNSPNLVVNKSWYLQGRLLEGDPLECCLLIQAAGTGSDCAFKPICMLPPYTLIWHYSTGSTCHSRPLLLTDTCFRRTLSRCTNYFAMLTSLHQRTPA